METPLERLQRQMKGDNPYKMTEKDIREEARAASDNFSKALKQHDVLSPEVKQARALMEAAQVRLRLFESKKNARGNTKNAGRNGHTNAGRNGHTRNNADRNGHPRRNGPHNQYTDLTVKQLKERLIDLGGSPEGIVERAELLSAVRAAAREAAQRHATPRRAPPPPPNSTRRNNAANVAEELRKSRAKAKAAANAERARAAANAKAAANARAARNVNRDTPEKFKTDYKLVDFYKALGITRRADKGAIKKAYRDMALKGEYRHPNKGGDQEKFKLIQRAFEILGDEDEKKEYDTYYNKKNP